MAANKSSLAAGAGAGAASVAFGMLGKFVAGLTNEMGSGLKGISVIPPSSSSSSSDAMSSFALVASGIVAGASMAPSKSLAVSPGELDTPGETTDPWVAAAGEIKSGQPNVVDGSGVPLLWLCAGGLANISWALRVRS